MDNMDITNPQSAENQEEPRVLPTPPERVVPRDTPTPFAVTPMKQILKEPVPPSNTSNTEPTPNVNPVHKDPRNISKNFLLVAIMGLVFLAGTVSGYMGAPKKTETQATPPQVIEVTPSVSNVDKTPVKNVNTTVEDIVADTLPALVSIQTKVEYVENYMFWGPQTVVGEASGSGFIVQITDKEVSVLTNAHVLEDAVEVTVTFNNGIDHKAIIKSCDTKADLALLAVDITTLKENTLDEIKCVTLGDSDTLRLGQSVIAIGNALGYGQSVTTGVVSALNRTMTGEDGTVHTWIQTDAAINAGNSGGVLLDMNGRVVGVNEAKIADTGVEGMGFAIPITYALNTIDELSSVEANFPVAEENRGKLGIGCVEILQRDSEMYNLPQGILVKEIYKDKAAAAADIAVNDIITAVAGTPTLTMSALSSAMSFHAVGETIEVTLMRNINGVWTEMVVEVTLQT